MIKKYLSQRVILLPLILCSNILSAQDNITDSLQQQLTKVNDSVKVEILLRLGNIYHSKADYEKAVSHKFEALQLAEKIQNKECLFKVLIELAHYYQFNGKPLQAEAFGLRAEKTALEQHNSQNLYEIYDLLGGIIYFNQQYYDKALTYADQMMEIAKKSNDRIQISYVQSFIGDIYRVHGRYDDALSIYNEALKTVRAAGDKDRGKTYLNNIAVIYEAQGLPEKAIGYYLSAIAIATEEQQVLGIMKYSISIAETYLELDSIDKAQAYARRALLLAEKTGEPKYAIKSSLILANIFASKKSFEDAYLHIKKADLLKDSLNATNLQNNLATFQAGYEIEKKDSEIGSLQAQNRLESTIRNILIGSAIILLTGLFLLTRQYRIKKQAQQQVEIKNSELETALRELKGTQAQLIQSEKMASLGELTAGIAHEIQNPLNFVNNFSEVNKELLTEMKEELRKGNLDDARTIANDIIDNEEKVIHHGKRADAIVKGMLQHSRSSSGLKEPTDINALVDEYLRLAYHGHRAKDQSLNVKINTSFDGTIGPIKVITQDIGRVILNLINNALYAVAEKKKLSGGEYEPAITVTTTNVNGGILIVVKDNGNGIRLEILDKIFQPFFTTKPTGQGTGLGLSLSYDIVKAHGGELKVETTEGEGSEFTVYLQQNKI